MKKILIAIYLCFLINFAFANHIKGGFLSYQYLGQGISNPSNLRYKISLTVYMVCNPSSGQLTNPISLTIFNGDGTRMVDNPSVSLTSQYNLGKVADDPCITDDQRGCYYTIVVYELNNYELPVSTDGYTISYQRCCRIASMDNVENSASVGNTYSIKIPGTLSPVPNANKNSSPNFAINDTAVVCGGNFFNFSLEAKDPDGDSLTYSLCAAFEGGTTNNPAPNPADPPSYGTVNYLSPYSGGQPMGSKVSLDPKTGMLSGIAPLIAFSGEYVVTVCVSEYRNGVFFAESRKELHIRVRDCLPIKARLDPKPVTCDGFSINFINGETLPSGTTYSWNFGDAGAGINNTSTASTPSHTYTDTGRYTVKLKVTSGGFCADSTTLVVKVYPGFFPAFNANPPFCKGIPVSFTDQTATNFGIPTGWHWDFGVASSTIDTSIAKNPFFTYTDAGLYKVKLIVGNTFGCIDTIFRDVTILDKAPLTVFPKDTSYCALDSVQLNATTIGAGVFTWSPAIRIINANTATPTVFPASATKYYVTLNQNGCLATDSVTVKPVNDVNAAITASAISICEDDTITLTGSSKYSNVSWQWSPASSMLTPTGKITKAFPATNTQYNLLVKWGNCTANATKDITVKPLAVANAGPDAAICNGQQTAQLQASGGISYQWQPSTGLSNANIANPIASPSSTTTYKVSVGIAGCSGLKIDSMIVLVRELPAINITNDTLICSIDTLQLQTNAAGNFIWSPNYMISNLTIPKPLVSPDVPTTYHVRLTDGFGCINTDSVFVDVKLFVTINAGNDTTICTTDGITINTVSDALSYRWTPNLYLSSDTAKRPLASPLIAQIKYYVIGNIGKCQSNDSITIKTVPYPIADAGNPVTICFGSSTQLNASGGSVYNWTPATFLSSTSIANPMVVKPTADTRYTVFVSDSLGCPKTVTDTVTVRVYPIVRASTGIRDTSIVQGQSLQMNATGGNQYQWSNASWLSNSNTANPVAKPEDNIEYKLLVTVFPQGCTGRDSVKIKVFKIPPSFYVPTAFSPNGDGNNEVLRPIPLGMKSINYFKVYNRLGQLMFSTTTMNKGWDGSYKGNPQDPATFVWIAQGETYTGEVITRKGYAVLVR
jgi:gliding motility-associated-like protein